MNKKRIIQFCVFCFFFFVCNTIYAANSAILAANRKTAVRCLKLAESYLSTGDWGNALSQAELGLAYDETVADLWYIKAASQSKMGSSKALVISLVTKALTEGEWVDYNRDGARILYADLLSDTGDYTGAITVLDMAPFIYSADAEYIRIKSYYCIGSKESVTKARDKINSARKIYPADKRFPHLFFKFEYNFNRGKNQQKYSDLMDESSLLLVQKIADSFIAKMPEYDNPDAELEIYATIFASGEKQRRMLQAFTAHGMSHPLYAKTALESKLINQQEAWDYFCTYADKIVSLEDLEDILPCITDEITIESVKEHLNCYEGTITIDTNYDCEPNLKIKYMRGRPSYFDYDIDSDDLTEWAVNCDFGVPETLELTQGNINITYGTYPFITQVKYNSETNGDTEFYLSDESFEWTPFDIFKNEIVYNLFKLDFFVPMAKEKIPQFNEDNLIQACSYYKLPSREKENASILVNMVNGKPQTAEYSYFNTIYAHAVFEDALPVLRAVDNDEDGVFETTEFYGYDPENTLNLSSESQEQVMTNLFGLPMQGSGIYLKMIQIDQNGDTIPDFSEEYLSSDGKITSWDYDGDGNWNVRYTRYPHINKDEQIVEEAQFYSSFDNKLVTISIKNGKPVFVVSGDEKFNVTQGAQNDFFWVGDEGTGEDELFVLTNFDSRTEQGVCVILQNEEKRILSVKIGNILYNQILTSTENDE